MQPRVDLFEKEMIDNCPLIRVTMNCILFELSIMACYSIIIVDYVIIIHFVYFFYLTIFDNLLVFSRMEGLLYM